MKLIIFTICLLIIGIPSFGQEIFGGVNFGSSKKIEIGDVFYPNTLTMESEFDVLWKSKKRKLIYNGLNLKFGINSPEGYKIGLSYKSIFGLNYNEEYSQHNIGIESAVGLLYQAPAAYTEVATYGVGLDFSLGIRFRFFQNIGAKIMYNLAYTYQYQIETLNIGHGFSIGFVAPLWVNNKSIFKRRRALKIQ